MARGIQTHSSEGHFESDLAFLFPFLYLTHLSATDFKAAVFFLGPCHVDNMILHGGFDSEEEVKQESAG